MPGQPVAVAEDRAVARAAHADHPALEAGGGGGAVVAERRRPVQRAVAGLVGEHPGDVAGNALPRRRLGHARCLLPARATDDADPTPQRGPTALSPRTAADHAGPMTTAAIRLLWLPLGAGGRSVRWNGRMFEAIAARVAHREPRDLYHAALEISVGDDRWVLEMAPAWSRSADRGVTVTGPVGLRPLGRSRLFRYEIRLWRDGMIPDRADAVGPPVRRRHERGPRPPTHRERRAGPGADLGTRRAWARRDVDVELGRLLVAHHQRSRRRRHRAPSRRPGARVGCRPSARVQDRGQLLDPVDQPGAGTGPGGVGVDGVHGYAGRQHARRDQLVRQRR